MVAPGIDGAIVAENQMQQRQQQEMGMLAKIIAMSQAQKQAAMQAEKFAMEKSLMPLQRQRLEAEIAKRNADAAGTAQQTQAQGMLASLLSNGGYTGPTVAPTAVAQSDADALRMVQEADARGEQLGVNVPNPQNVKALSSIAYPKEFGGALSKSLFPSNNKSTSMVVKVVPDSTSQTGFSYRDMRDPTVSLGAAPVPSSMKPAGEGAPYFTPVQTTNGVASFNNRTGQAAPVTILGQPLIRPQDDPVLQGRIAERKAEGTAIGQQKAVIGGKQDAIDSISEAKTLLDKGIYTGAYAPIKMGIVKWTPGVETDKAARTEEFLSHIGNIVIPRLKEFGGNDSNEEMRYLTRVMGGDIKLEEPAIRAILIRAEKNIQRGIARLQSIQGAAGGQQQSGWSAEKEKRYQELKAKQGSQ